MNKKILLPIVAFIVVVSICFVFGNIFVNKITDKIKQEIRQELIRDYVPGPYSPGFDPDKITPKFKAIPPSPVRLEVKTPQEWNETWEKSRL